MNHTPYDHLTDDMVMCRTVLHAWEEIPDRGGTKRAFRQSKSTIRITFRCTRCAMLRLEAWSAVTGDLLFRQYQPPAGYKLANRKQGARKLLRQEYLYRKEPKGHQRREAV